MIKEVERPYFKNLDLFRFVAASLVFIFHLQLHYWNKLSYEFTLHGYLGRFSVSAFFFLSGFLLTYLLYSEKDKKGSINVKNFYIRRIIRIWPLYYSVLIIGFYIYPFLLNYFTGYCPSERASKILYFTFFSNYDVAYINYPTSAILGVQWSLAVEEQFYILLPLLFFVISKNIFVNILVSFFIIVLSIVYKIYVFPYYDTLSVIYNFFGGIMLSALIYKYPQFIVKFLTYPVKVLMLLLLIAYIALIQLYGLNAIAVVYKAIIELIIFSAVISLLTLGYSGRELFPLFNRLGRNYAYSIYLLHMIAVVFSKLLFQYYFSIHSFWVYALVSTLLLIILCYSAEKFIEKPFLRLKTKFY